MCPDDFKKFTNGNIEIEFALEWGHIRIDQVPEELWAEDAVDERLKWLEDRIPDELRKLWDDIRESSIRLSSGD